MADVFSPKKRSEIMRAVRGRGTKPEATVSEALRAGSRFTLERHAADLPGEPDIVVRSRRVAIFVHGCFWHGHACKRGARVPQTRRAYWLAKIARNRARDRRVRRRLRRLGWHVFTVWECRLTAARGEATVRRLLQRIRNA